MDIIEMSSKRDWFNAWILLWFQTLYQKNQKVIRKHNSIVFNETLPTKRSKNKLYLIYFEIFYTIMILYCSCFERSFFFFNVDGIILPSQTLPIVYFTLISENIIRIAKCRIKQLPIVKCIVLCRYLQLN